MTYLITYKDQNPIEVSTNQRVRNNVILSNIQELQSGIQTEEVTVSGSRMVSRTVSPQRVFWKRFTSFICQIVGCTFIFETCSSKFTLFL